MAASLAAKVGEVSMAAMMKYHRICSLCVMQYICKNGIFLF